ncbi:MAG: hypothetical protein AAFX99_10115, partial [Myxococcota bacterium]
RPPHNNNGPKPCCERVLSASEGRNVHGSRVVCVPFFDVHPNQRYLHNRVVEHPFRYVNDFASKNLNARPDLISVSRPNTHKKLAGSPF